MIGRLRGPPELSADSGPALMLERIWIDQDKITECATPHEHVAMQIFASPMAPLLPSSFY